MVLNEGGESVKLIVQYDTIFVSGMNPDLSKVHISEYFGQIGTIKLDKRRKKQKIWLYKNKATGVSNGEATVTYEDPTAAESAILWLNGKEFQGYTIKVEFATIRDKWNSSNDGGGDAGDWTTDSDWRCPKQDCENTNITWRTYGKRCSTPKLEDAPERARESTEDGDGDASNFSKNRQSRDGYWRCSNQDSENTNCFGWKNQCNKYYSTPEDTSRIAREDGGSDTRDFVNNRQSLRRYWKCLNQNCKYINFTWRNQCNKCSAPKPEGALEIAYWRCSNQDCGNINYAWRNQCNRCSAPKPEGGASGIAREGREGGGGDAGDYFNQQSCGGYLRYSNQDCKNTNCAWRNQCNECRAPKPEEASGIAREGGGGDAGDFSKNRQSRDGYWRFSNQGCETTNCTWRNQCNKCSAPKSESNTGSPDCERGEDDDRPGISSLGES